LPLCRRCNGLEKNLYGDVEYLRDACCRFGLEAAAPAAGEVVDEARVYAYTVSQPPLGHLVWDGYACFVSFDVLLRDKEGPEGFL
jgi:hypothetical protein